jgi:hypothetical protein
MIAELAAPQVSLATPDEAQSGKRSESNQSIVFGTCCLLLLIELTMSEKHRKKVLLV